MNVVVRIGFRPLRYAITAAADGLPAEMVHQLCELAFDLKMGGWGDGYVLEEMTRLIAEIRKLRS